MSRKFTSSPDSPALPGVVSSMRQFEAITGLPVTFLRMEKRRGNPGFTGSGRIHTRLFLSSVDWKAVLGRKGVAPIDLDHERALAHRARREQLDRKNSQAEAELRSRVEQIVWETTLQPLKHALDSMPQSLCGFCNPDNPALARGVIEGYLENLKAKLRAQLETPHS